MSSSQANDIALPPLSGPMLILAAVMIAAANFVAVLDSTIANVSVATISGALGSSTSQARTSSRPMRWPKRSRFR